MIQILKYWTLVSCYGNPINSVQVEVILLDSQYLALMSNRSLELCIKNVLSSVVTEGALSRVVLYYSLLDFLPRGTWLVPSTQPRLFLPRFMPHYVLPQFPFSAQHCRSLRHPRARQKPCISVSVHMILLQLPSMPTWELNLMILPLFSSFISPFLFLF